MKISIAVVLIAALVPLSAAAQSAPPAPEPYRPGLGDLMTMTVQPRHIKLCSPATSRTGPMRNTNCTNCRRHSSASSESGRDTRACRSAA